MTTPTRGVFRHGVGNSETLEWIHKNTKCHTLIFFVPGNPGLLDFYIPFLSSIYEQADGEVTIVGHGHIGHSPAHPLATSGDAEHGVVPQAEAALEAFDSAHKEYATGSGVRVIIVGHSVGSWIATQILKARPKQVTTLFLLTPTVSNMAKTPNGRSMWWLFRPPVPKVISYLTNIASLLPSALLPWLFHQWPAEQLTVLRSLISSPSAAYSTLTMARSELDTIKDLDIAFLDEYHDRIFWYFAESDDWVGEEKAAILARLSTAGASGSAGKVVQCRMGIPHAFCINHSIEMAITCSQWLRAL